MNKRNKKNGRNEGKSCVSRRQLAEGKPDEDKAGQEKARKEAAEKDLS